MNEQKTKSNPSAHGSSDTAVKPRPGLRLIKTAPEDIINQITAGGIEAKRAATLAKAKANPLVKQLSGLADALDAEVAMILKM